MDIGLLSTIFRFIIFLVQIYYFGMIIYFFTSWAIFVLVLFQSGLVKIFNLILAYLS